MITLTNPLTSYFVPDARVSVRAHCFPIRVIGVYVSGAPSMERELIERCVGRAPSVER